ncbi:MAG: hypothetical protein FWD34_07550 [Oscillospiraceae bacterium]|nr:hypothetical protein [Oscillospiraceae bacterium]
MKNYEIYLIRHGENSLPYPNVGKVYVSPNIACTIAAQSFYPKHTLHTAMDFRERDPAETDEQFALRCVCALNLLFSDLTRSGITKAAIITDEEAIVTLVAGCGLPKGDPVEFMLEPGEGWLISMCTYLWQKGNTFEIVGKLTLNE